MTQPTREYVAEKLSSDDPRLRQLLTLIRDSFAGMEGRIDPPSSIHRLTLENIRQHCIDGEVWAIGTPVIACMFLTPRGNTLCLGKLAVAALNRGCGLARQLVSVAEERAHVLGKSHIEIQTRVELVENQQTFARLGFSRSGESSHPGYTRATSVTMQKPV